MPATTAGVEPVRLGADPIAVDASSLSEVGDALVWASTHAQHLPTPGSGRTATLWATLATIAARDLEAARAVEPHLDAVAILRQADRDDLLDHGTWGVFAAEGGGAPLQAQETARGWRLDGEKPWCSLADRLDAALITAHVTGGRRLFAVRLRDAGVAVGEGVWAARGLVGIPSGSVRFADVEAEPVGEPGWYLERPGFAWGGIGVAACWYGGAVGIGRTLHAALADRADDVLAMMHLGAVDELLASARLALVDAAHRIDTGDAVGARGSLLAKRVRAIVANAVEGVLMRSAHALGPAPLALDADHAQRVADLELYVRQHHAERDLASLGRSVAGDRPW